MRNSQASNNPAPATVAPIMVVPLAEASGITAHTILRGTVLHFV